MRPDPGGRTVRGGDRVSLKPVSRKRRGETPWGSKRASLPEDWLPLRSPALSEEQNLDGKEGREKTGRIITGNC